MASDDDQQFCLRWNNFQANITSQFEALRDDEDFTDVTIACDGQKLHAHKVVLSACSPFFKELFKGNPCHHPIIFMRDVEAQHIAALIEFMYAGEVNIAQAHLSTFLKTAESLKIRGLTDTSTGLVPQDLHEDKCETEEVYKHRLECTSQDEQDKEEPPSISSPLSKRQCRSESDLTDNAQIEDVGLCKRQFKMELPDYLSDGDGKDDSRQTDKIFYGPTELSGAMEIIPHTSGYSSKGETTADLSSRKFRSSENWIPFGPFSQNDDSLDLSRGTVRTRNKRIKLGEGIEICEDQLNSLKWNDYRKLTRGLATILFSPAELATCSVTGQKWSRAGSGERPIKPALDRAKVQAIISYVATRFPLVEISRIKQVLAYKCKENSTALKMKAVRYYGDQMNK